MLRRVEARAFQVVGKRYPELAVLSSGANSPGAIAEQPEVELDLGLDESSHMSTGLMDLDFVAATALIYTNTCSESQALQQTCSDRPLPYLLTHVPSASDFLIVVSGSSAFRPSSLSSSPFTVDVSPALTASKTVVHAVAVP
jgi:hypothetical protein